MHIAGKYRRVPMHLRIIVSCLVSFSFQLSEPSLWGLEALCALGLLQSDVTLATAVQEELFKHGGANSHNAQVVFLDMVLNIQKARYLVSCIINIEKRIYDVKSLYICDVFGDRVAPSIHY